MPVTYDFDPETALIQTRCKGDVTFEEVLGHFRQLEADSTLPARLDILLDLTEMESLPASDQLRSVVREVERLEAKVKWGACAIVASRDALYGMTRMFQVFAEGHFESSCVFRSGQEARDWLDARRSGPA